MRQAYFASAVAEKERFLERLLFSTMKNLLRVAGSLPPAEREASLNQARGIDPLIDMRHRHLSVRLNACFSFATEGGFDILAR